MSAAYLFEQKSVTTADHIANHIREDILRGKLQADQVLRQDKIASFHGVSTIPVREALFQLNGEGLIEFIPHRGAFVSTLTQSALNEICQIRCRLELLALEYAIPNLTDADLDQAEQLMEAMLKQTDMVKWAEQNWQFHKTLWGPSNMPNLIQILRNLHINVNRYLAKNVPTIDDATYHNKHHQEHLNVLEACRKRDTEVAIIQLRRHLDGATDLISSFNLDLEENT